MLCEPSPYFIIPLISSRLLSSPLLSSPLLSSPLLSSLTLISSGLCYQLHSHHGVIIGLGVSRPCTTYTGTQSHPPLFLFMRVCSPVLLNPFARTRFLQFRLHPNASASCFFLRPPGCFFCCIPIILTVHITILKYKRALV